jgi:hypothetical protein
MNYQNIATTSFQKTFSLIVLVALVLSLLPLSQVYADSPNEVDGNPDCEDYSLTGFKIDPPVNGTTDGISYTLSDDGKFLDWDAIEGVSVSKVIIKGGNKANVYSYNPPIAFSDSDLVSPLNNGGQIPKISHFEFCISDSLSDPETAKLTIEKVVQVPEGAEYEVPSAWSFDFTHVEGEPFPLTNVVDTKEFSGEIVGEHNFAEGSLPADWYFKSISCTGEGFEGSQWDVEGQALTVTLEDGDDVTCTFTNEYRTSDENTCDEGYVLEGEQCVPDENTCDEGYVLEGEQCVPDEPTPVQCLVGENLLLNGSFEEPVADENSYEGGFWEVFGTIPGWAVTNSVEIWNNMFGGASDGEQNIELDVVGPSKITQTVTTVPGATYELRYDFSARPGTNEADNQLGVLVDGELIETHSADGMAMDQTDWVMFTQEFVATSSEVEIGFEDLGTSNGTGTLLDNAVLCLVELPDPVEPDDTPTISSGGSRGSSGSRVRPELPPQASSVAGEATSRPVGRVLGDQVSAVPLGAATTGAGGTAPVAPSSALIYGIVVPLARRD